MKLNRQKSTTTSKKKLAAIEKKIGKVKKTLSTTIISTKTSESKARIEAKMKSSNTPPSEIEKYKEELAILNNIHLDNKFNKELDNFPEDVYSKSEKLKSLYEERNAKAAAHVDLLRQLDQELEKTPPQDETIESLQKEIKNQKKSLMKTDGEIDKITSEPAYLEREVKKTDSKINRTAISLGFILASLVISIVSLPAIIAGSPVLGPLALAVGVSIGIASLVKLGVEIYLDYNENKKLKEEKYNELLDEAMEKYEQDLQEEEDLEKVKGQINTSTYGFAKTEMDENPDKRQDKRKAAGTPVQENEETRKEATSVSKTPKPEKGKVKVKVKKEPYNPEDDRKRLI